jgi:hypothetical protein
VGGVRAPSSVALTGGFDGYRTLDGGMVKRAVGKFGESRFELLQRPAGGEQALEDGFAG